MEVSIHWQAQTRQTLPILPWPFISAASPDCCLCFLLHCSAMQNLREAIAGYRARLLHEGNDVKRNALLQVTRIVVWCRPVLLVLLPPRCLMARWHDHNHSLAAPCANTAAPSHQALCMQHVQPGLQTGLQSLAMAVMVM